MAEAGRCSAAGTVAPPGTWEGPISTQHTARLGADAPDPIAALRRHLAGIAAAAATEDQDGAFPSGSLERLRKAGLLVAPALRSLGGLGWGIEAPGAVPLGRALRLLGRASLPLGRLYEGHVNALRLVQRRGSPAQARLAAREAAAGHLFGVWNTDPPAEPPLTLDAEGRLQGRKVLCSGAGHVTRALVTARRADAPDLPQMLLVSLLPGGRADLSGWTALGMRASATGSVAFDGVPVSAAMVIGAPGDYARQPDFSAGAWRFAAVQCGGTEAVLGALRHHLKLTGRGADPHQAARLGQAAIAAETARLWAAAAAARAEAEPPAADAVTYANLARLAVERAALEVLELTQRSVGLAAFLRPNPLERLCRDLATYLRQPAPDHALASAAADILAARAEPGDLWHAP